MSVLPACVYVSHVQAWCPWIPEEGSESPDPGVTGESMVWVLGVEVGLLHKQLGALSHLTTFYFFWPFFFLQHFFREDEGGKKVVFLLFF